jgi:hypothetical protein
MSPLCIYMHIVPLHQMCLEWTGGSRHQLQSSTQNSGHLLEHRLVHRLTTVCIDWNKMLEWWVMVVLMQGLKEMWIKITMTLSMSTCTTTTTSITAGSKPPFTASLGWRWSRVGGDGVGHHCQSNHHTRSSSQHPTSTILTHSLRNVHH